MIVCIRLVTPLARHMFLGHEFWIPKNAKKTAAAYGFSWRTPVQKLGHGARPTESVERGEMNDLDFDRRIIAEYLDVKTDMILTETTPWVSRCFPCYNEAMKNKLSITQSTI